jgi:hypothetical protein
MPTMASMHHKERPAIIVSDPSRPSAMGVHALCEFKTTITPQSARLCHPSW